MVIYQIFTRLWGNLQLSTRYKVLGTRAENGCGGMNAVTTKALHKLRDMGVTHVWYTGLLAHASATDYSAFGIPRNHSAMVKGRAGSPYAVRDYYDLDPDLASSPERRWDEFRTLIERTHKAGLRVIMDFVPNHVAREYHSVMKPEGVRDLGEDDEQSLAFSPQNNFYYLPGQPLACSFDMKGEEAEPYVEMPAKATGNDCFTPCPGRNDWYETVKLNYGIDYCNGGAKHFAPRPSTWEKMADILLYWAQQGVDGFRCDMAEMVPQEFWGYATKRVRALHPNIIFIGEVYNPGLYRTYLAHGFDLLYDKVGLYDTLRAVVGGQSATSITGAWQAVDDIAGHMLNFLENHDEQRIASDFFAGSAEKGKPALAVQACMRGQAQMIYFGQELGERGMDEEGFSGRDGRTTIFDYWSVRSIREWQAADYCTKKLRKETQALRSWYKKVLLLSQTEPALKDGAFFDLMYANYQNADFDCHRLFAFLRKWEDVLILVVANFSDHEQTAAPIIPAHAFDCLELKEGDFEGRDLLNNRRWSGELHRDGRLRVNVPAQGAAIVKIYGN